MKKLTLIFALTFSVMFSSSSYAGWIKVSENENDTAFYVDFERIRKVDGYVYWWELIDLAKPSPHGDLSRKTYNQGDCKLFRYKVLSSSIHTEPMGGGIGDAENKPDTEWTYPFPNTVDELSLKEVCSW